MKKKNKIVKQENNVEFIDNDMKYVPEPATMGGRKGNIWTVSKRIKSEWITLGQVFANKSANKDNIINTAMYLFVDKQKNLSNSWIVALFMMAFEHLTTRFLNIFRK